MFEPLRKIPFSSSSARLEFEVKKRTRADLESDFTVDGNLAVPKLYFQGGVSEGRVFIDDYSSKSVFLQLGRVFKKGIGFSDGNVNVRVPGPLPEWTRAFLGYAVTVNVLNDKDNRHVRRLFEKKVRLRINGEDFSRLVGRVHGLEEAIGTLFDNLDRTMTAYFRDALGKENVFSVKFLPVSASFLDPELVGTGVLEVRFRARDGSLYTRNYGVRYGVLINTGEGFVEDDAGNPVSVMKVISGALVVGGAQLDGSTARGILRRYTHGTVTLEAFMRVADPEFFVSTLGGSAYVEPDSFKVAVGEIGLNFLVTFKKRHVHGGIGDFGVTDLVKRVSLSVKVYDGPIRAYPVFSLSSGNRSHLILSTVRRFLLSVLSSAVLHQSELSIGFVKPKNHLLVSGTSKVADGTPLFVGSEPVGVMSLRGLKEYITSELPSDPEKFSRTPKAFPYDGVLHVGLPHKTVFGTVIPVMTPEEMEEGSRAYIYSLLVSRGKLYPIRLSTTVEAVEKAP